MQTLASHLPGLVKMSGQASILILLVLAAQWLCGPRLQPRWRCALWLLVLLRLALPWTLPSPASLFNVVKLPAAAPHAPPEMAPAPMMDAPISTAEGVGIPVSSAGGHWLAWLWAAGALCLAGCAAVNHYKIHRRVRRRRPLSDGPTLKLLEDCKALMGVRIPVTLIETGAIQSPTLFGFVRPRFLLPIGFVSSFTREELRHVFLHELAHIKRHDILTGWVTLGLQTVHWFNPLVWLAFHRLRSDRELACDALALSCARAGENESYGLTIIKLLEGFGQSAWAPSVAGILENKQQMKERISMIAKYKKTNRGLALAVSLLAGLALVTMTDAQDQTQARRVKIGEPDAAQGVWAVAFEPVGDFSPKTPAEFLARIHQYSTTASGRDGEIGYFRTAKQGDRLVGWFLAYDPDQLQAALAAVPGIKVTSSCKLTQEQLTDYKKSPQESLIERASDATWLPRTLALAQSGDKWAVYCLWYAYYHGWHGVQPDQAEADKWLQQVVQFVWVVKFEPVDDFAPKTPREFLARIHQYSTTASGRDGEIGCFRTTRQGDRLLGSYLSYDPDQLKAALATVPGVKVTSVEKLTAEGLLEYDKSRQESLDEGSSESKALRERIAKKVAQDQEKYTPEQLREAESLYQVANQKWGSREASESLQTMIKKYPDINRTGCAMLYLAQKSEGDERAQYLQDCVEKFNDCFYGDGVQVGAFARFLLAGDYRSKGDEEKAAAIYNEIKSNYADAIDHNGKLLVNSMKADSK